MKHFIIFLILTGFSSLIILSTISHVEARPYMSSEDLFNGSQFVLEGKIISKKIEPSQNYIIYDIKIEKYLKGILQNDVIQVHGINATGGKLGNTIFEIGDRGLFYINNYQQKYDNNDLAVISPYSRVLENNTLPIDRESCCDNIVTVKIDSPLKQFKSGIPVEQIQCREGLMRLIKFSDNSLICVKPKTMQKLIERGCCKTSGIASANSDLVIPSGNGFKPSLTIEGLNNTYDIGQKIEFTVKYNGTKSGCPDYPSLRVEDSKHQTVWDSGVAITFCDYDTTPIHVEKTWKIGNAPLGSPIINKTGFYTLFAEFEKDIIQQGFWVKQQSQVRIVNGAVNPEQNRNYLPENITVVIGINNTVTWINEDLVPNSVTSDLEGFDSGSIHPGASWTFTFDREGFYGYHSEPHPWMKGMVVVELLNKKESSSNSTYSREITVLSISPENVTLPDPKPKAPAKHDGWIQE